MASSELEHSHSDISTTLESCSLLLMIYGTNNLKTDVMHEYSGEEYLVSFVAVIKQESRFESYFYLIKL